MISKEHISKSTEAKTAEQIFTVDETFYMVDLKRRAKLMNTFRDAKSPKA